MSRGAGPILPAARMRREYLGMLKHRGITYDHPGAERLGAALRAIGGVKTSRVQQQRTATDPAEPPDDETPDQA
jgi:hypothetical protein